MWEKVVVPGVVSHAGQSIGEGAGCLAGPVHVNRFSVSPGQVIEPVDDQCVEAEQARFNTQDCVTASSASCFQTQVLSHFFERDFDIPATDERFHDTFDAHPNGGAKEVFVPMTAGQITHMNPAQLNETLSLAIPVSGAGDYLDSSCSSTIPLHCQTLAVFV